MTQVIRKHMAVRALPRKRGQLPFNGTVVDIEYSRNRETQYGVQSPDGKVRWRFDSEIVLL